MSDPNFTLEIDEYHGGTRHPPHWHDELHLSLVLRGGVAESVAGTTENASALSIVAKDAGVVHQDEFAPAGATLARLTLPGGTIGALIDRSDRANGWSWIHRMTTALPFLRLVERARSQPAEFATDDPDVTDLLAGVTARPAPISHGAPPGWLRQTMEALRETWHPRLRVADLARQAGVHPVYLARSVRRWYGTGVAEEMRRLRLRAAMQALARGEGPISRVAHAHGYADEAHLSRECRCTVGTTPGRYRALLRSIGPHSSR
jgi:AraC family transcriptional regulator